MILSSGVWTQKFENTFDRTSMKIVAGLYNDSEASDVEQLTRFVQGMSSTISEYSGEIVIEGGELVSNNVTIIHKRSVAEDIKFYRDNLSKRYTHCRSG